MFQLLRQLIARTYRLTQLQRSATLLQAATDYPLTDRAHAALCLYYSGLGL